MNNNLPKKPPVRATLDKRTGLINTGWKTLAPTDSFGGFTQAQYGDKRQNVFELRTQLGDAEQEVKRLRDLVQKAELDLWGVSGLVTRGVAGDPKFGPNSALYGSFGLVRSSDRKSGLTRKSDALATEKRLVARSKSNFALSSLKPLELAVTNGNGNGDH